MKHQLIIGDNCAVLNSCLLPTYKDGIKMVYIDPPYNTQTVKSYVDNIDSETWLKAINSVIKALRLLLREDGVLFISIDDSEYANLKLLCDKIFGKVNFIGTFITKQAQRSNSKFINIVHEYVLAYAKDITKIERFTIKRMDIPEQREMINDLLTQVGKEIIFGIKTAENRLHNLIDQYCKQYDITWLKNYNCVDSSGEIYFASDLSVPGTPRTVDIGEINLHLEPLKTRGWVSDKRFIELHKKGLLVFRNKRPYFKKYLKNAEDNVPSILNFYSRHGTRDLNKLGLRDLFDTPKPVELIKFLIRAARVAKGDYVLDCYAGSGTTGQAVLEVNLEDKTDIGFILIQKKEKICKQHKIYESCQRYGIEPDMSAIIKLRLNKVYEKFFIKSKLECIDYE